MIALLSADLGTADQSPLAWRWTDPRWNVLPAEKLTRVRPLAETKAREVWEHSRRFVEGSGLRRSLFPGAVEFDDSGNASPDLARAWLKARPVAGDPELFVCWGDDLAVLTDWSVFCEFWDDFCYPLERVLVWPKSGGWVLLYHPEERLYFGRAAAETGAAPERGGI